MPALDDLGFVPKDDLGFVPAARPSPHQKFVRALSGIMPSIPGQTDADKQEATGNAVGMGMGMTMPNPLAILRGLRGSAPAQAADPVIEQIRRVNAASGGGETTNPLPELPKALDWVLPSKATKLYKLLRGVTEREAGPASTPYPTEPAYIPPPRQGVPPPAAAAAASSVSPEMQAGAEASRARVLSRIQPAAEQAAPAAAAVEQAPQAVTRVAEAAPEQTAINIFEKSARAQKVQELVKAIDANAGAHLGVDPLDPRFAEAIAEMPQEWWEGMANVAKINKPSSATVQEVAAFFRDRAAQAAQ